MLRSVNQQQIFEVISEDREPSPVFLSSDIATIAPVPLTEAQKRSAKGMQIVWDSHFIDGACPKGFPCADRTWPNG